jgi:hypothetical protein
MATRKLGLSRCRVERLDTSRFLDDAAALVSVFVSFVVVRLGSWAAAERRVEHVADADDRARTLIRRTRKRVWVKVHRGFKSHRHRQI